MKLLFVVFFLTATTAIGALCVFCIIQPRKVTAYLRADYTKSFIKLPTMKIVFMEWFPIYLRGMGFMGLIVVLIALVDFLQQISK